MLIGSSYYPELMEREQWRQDLLTAKEVGLSVLRCGEFSWFALCPDADSWNAEWVKAFLDLCHEVDIKVVWCTPSATPPPYLHERWPDLQAIDRQGRVVPVGVRRNYCPSHMGYRRLAAEIAGRLASEISDHPAVMGWQVDNEIAGDGFTCWCEHCAVEFRNWLRKRYGDLEALNAKWQTGVWGQHYTSWEQIPVPSPDFSSHTPSIRLAYRRFRSDNWLAFYQTQAEALRENGAQKICTNFFNYTWDAPFDLHRWAKEMDAVGIGNYLEDPAEIRFQLELLRGLSGGDKPMWVLEQKAGQQRAQNILPDNMQRLKECLQINREYASEVAVYWHLRQHSAGCEQEHGAVLRHDGKPGRIARIITEAIDETEGVTEKHVPNAPLLVFSFDQHWANEQRPPQGEAWSYMETLQQWHAAACDICGDANIVSPERLENTACAKGQLILAPHLQIRRDAALRGLFAAASVGATIVLTADCARLDEENNVLRQKPLSFLSDGEIASLPVPELEILQPQKAYCLQGCLGDESFYAHAFWAFADANAHIAPECMELGTLQAPVENLRSPLAYSFSHGQGRLIILLAKPDSAGIRAILSLLGCM